MKRNNSSRCIIHILLILSFCATGCDKIVISPQKTPNTVNVTVSQESAAIYNAMVEDKVSKDDAEILYKNFVGLVNYLPHSTKLDSTPKLMQIIKEFQLEYGYSRGSYPKLTDEVEKHLVTAGYKLPKKIVAANATENEVLKSQVVSDLKVVADSVEKYLKGMK